MKNKTIIKSLLILMIMCFVMSFSRVCMAETMVYYTDTGVKYHYIKTCRGLRNAKNTRICSLTEAKNKGLSACAICGGGTPGTDRETSTNDNTTSTNKNTTKLARPVFSKWEGYVAYWDTVDNADYYKVKIYINYTSSYTTKSISIEIETSENTYDISPKVKECLQSNQLYGELDDFKVSIGIVASSNNAEILDSEQSAAASSFVHTHDFSEENAEIIKVQTCTDIGLKIYTCPLCGRTKREYLRSLGHDYEVTKQINPTIFEKGCLEKTCKRCGNIEKESISKLKTKVTLNQKTIKLTAGTKQKIKIKKKTKGDKLSKWTTSNKRVATVNKKGVVTGKSKGKTTIKVIMKSGCTSKCKVTVN